MWPFQNKNNDGPYRTSAKPQKKEFKKILLENGKWISEENIAKIHYPKDCTDYWKETHKIFEMKSGKWIRMDGKELLLEGNIQYFYRTLKEYKIPIPEDIQKIWEEETFADEMEIK